MGISFGSIQTGLPKDIVQQIMKAEKIPIQRMESKKGKVANKLKLLNELGEHIKTLRSQLFKNGDSRGFKEYSATANKDIVDVTVDKESAAPGTYQVEVQQLAHKSSAVTNGFPDRDETSVGVGYIQYNLPSGDTRDVYIDSENSTLDGIAKLINKDRENGMSASVINDGSNEDNPFRLILSLNDTGDENLAEFPYFYFVDGDEEFYIDQERGAQDAKVTIDGFPVEFSSNRVKDAIPGLTIDLKKAKPGEEFAIQVKEDSGKMKEKLDEFIAQLNQIFGFINKQNTMDETTDTSQTLGGDISLQNIESRLRTAIFKPIETDKGFKRLSELGINFQRNGTLAMNNKKFENLVKTKYVMVEQVLAGWVKKDEDGEVIGNVEGFFQNLKKTISSILNMPGGIIYNRKTGLQSVIKQMDKRIESRLELLERKEQSLKKRFANLEGSISKIRNQGAGLASMAQSAPDPVAKLG